MKSATVVSVLLLLAGCSSAPLEQLASTPLPRPTAAVDVPVQSSQLKAGRQQVPPVRVQIPAVGIDIAVQPVGTKPDGQMEIPEDIRVGGWYKYGADPESAAGSTVITAHVDSFDQGLGPFGYLKEVPAGSEVIVTTADGLDHRYTVSSVQNVSKSQLPLDQVFDREGTPRLVLITCGGQFDENVFNYSDNVVAIANPA